MAQTATTQAEVVKGIDRQELKDKIDRRESFVLLETLSPEHFQHLHLPGARNAPPDRVKQLAPVLIPSKQTEIVTYCAGPSPDPGPTNPIPPLEPELMTARVSASA